MPALPRPDVITAAWNELRCLRDFHHHPRRCPTGPAYASRMLHGGPIPHHCQDCYDVLVDALEHLRAVTTPDVTAAYARGVIRRHVVDRLRTANTALHGVAKPERRDGVPGRIRTHLHTRPDGDWLDTLLTLVLRAASARAPVPHCIWPFDAFAAAHPDNRSADHVRGDVDVVLRAIRDVAGHRWFDDHITAPLRARTALYNDLIPGDLAEPDRPDTDRDALLHALAQHVHHPPSAALQHALADLGIGPIDTAAHFDATEALVAELRPLLQPTTMSRHRPGQAASSAPEFTSHSAISMTSSRMERSHI